MATLLEQSIEWQRKQIADLALQIATAKSVADTAYAPYRAMRGKIADAKANPNTTPEQLAALVAEQESLRDRYFTAREKQESLEQQSARIESALESNISKLNDPQQNPSFGNGDATTSATANGQDPLVNKQTTIQQNANSIPDGQVSVGLDPPSAGTDPFEQSRLDAQILADNTPPTEQDVIDAEQDPFERARLEVAQNNDNISPTEQDVIDAEQDPFERARLDVIQQTSTTPDYEFPEDIDVSQDPAEDAKFKRQQASANGPISSTNPGAKGSARGLSGKTQKTRAQATAQDNANYNLLKDWRVRLALAPGAEQSKYLYWADNPGILAPLRDTQGVIFPYTPQVQVNYTANYDPTELVHSNYKVYQYRGSAVDSISITSDFTAQDTFEANYLLAVIHFFRSVTKMFYGQDTLPVNGTPPPLCYLYGYGEFGFNKHPLAITSFNCNFPNDVDYIRATTNASAAGVNTSASNIPSSGGNGADSRTSALGNLAPGGASAPTQWSNPKTSSNNTGGSVDPTYVPTKMQIQITAAPIISRNDVSRSFSLQKYATGELLQGSKRPDGGGIW